MCGEKDGERGYGEIEWGKDVWREREGKDIWREEGWREKGSG